jgi:protein-tyrosine phosphatase
MRILFVCSGNICRSPMAEALFVHMARERRVIGRFEADSVGLHGYHEGEAADPRTRRLGARHGVEVTSVAREIVPADIVNAGLVVAMDRGHERQLQALAPPEHRHKIRLMRSYDPDGGDPDVADPYYGGIEGFERMYEVLERCCRRLLDELLEPDATGAGVA